MSVIIRKPLMGIILGGAAGIIDVIPMTLYNFPIETKVSAFSLWIISGFLIAVVSIPISGAPKGLLVSVLVFIPSAILIGAKDPLLLMPMAAMALLLGSFPGYMIDRHRENRRGL